MYHYVCINYKYLNMQSMSIVEPRCSSAAVNGKSHHKVQWLLVTYIVTYLDHII